MAVKVLLVSSGQPSVNPRLIKEADTLSQNGYDVTVLYAYWNDWATLADEQLLPQKKWKAIRAGGHPTEKPFIYFLSRVIHKLSVVMVRLFKVNWFGEFAIARSGFFLMTTARRYKSDLYIGHNLAALTVVVREAKKHRAKCGFDAEDFHRNEVSDDANDPDVILKSYIEQKYIPQVNYISASSEGIAAAYRKIFPSIQPVVVRNVFETDNSIPAPVLNKSGPLRLFWFSQTIGPKRGLDDVIGALHQINNQKIELHLLGDLPKIGVDYLADLDIANITIQINQPIPGKDLNRHAARFDIGLATEPGFCVNNNLALSNKIFTYMQAGLAIIASDTSAQRDLFNDNPEIGTVYEKENISMLVNIISHYNKNRDVLLNAKNASYQAARQKLNWEIESLRFIAIVADTLNK